MVTAAAMCSFFSNIVWMYVCVCVLSSRDVFGATSAYFVLSDTF